MESIDRSPEDKKDTSKNEVVPIDSDEEGLKTKTQEELDKEFYEELEREANIFLNKLGLLSKDMEVAYRELERSKSVWNTQRESLEAFIRKTLADLGVNDPLYISLKTVGGPEKYEDYMKKVQTGRENLGFFQITKKKKLDEILSNYTFKTECQLASKEYIEKNNELQKLIADEEKLKSEYREMMQKAWQMEEELEKQFGKRKSSYDSFPTRIHQFLDKSTREIEEKIVEQDKENRKQGGEKVKRQYAKITSLFDTIVTKDEMNKDLHYRNPNLNK